MSSQGTREAKMHRFYVLILAMLCPIAFGHDIVLRFTGEMSFAAAGLPSLRAAVLSKISDSVNVDETCLDLQVDFSTNDENSSQLMANYTVTIKQDRCDIVIDILAITEVKDLGIKSFYVNPDLEEESEFWKDKMNSILVFCGCGILIIIILVTCVILTARCHRAGQNRQSSTSSKQHLYQPYAADTMTMDIRKKKRDRFDTVDERHGRHNEPTTIERWVHSQLSKSKSNSGTKAIDMNHGGTRFADYRKDHLHPDVSTTDSGIVTTSPRRSHRKSSYVLEDHQPIEQSEGVYKKLNSSLEKSFDREPVYETCVSIDYTQHDNGAYASDQSSQLDSDSIEESSKL